MQFILKGMKEGGGGRAHTHPPQSTTAINLQYKNNSYLWHAESHLEGGCQSLNNQRTLLAWGPFSVHDADWLQMD